MAIRGVSPSASLLSAYTSQAQAGAAQKNHLLPLPFEDDSAKTHFSAFGQVKSSLAELQDKAQALRNFSQPPTLDDFKSAVRGFVQSLNALNKTVHDVTRKQGSTSQDARPGQALSEVRKAFAGSRDDNSVLQQLGIGRDKEGALSIDQKRLDRTFQNDRTAALSTFSAVAGRVAAVIDNQLSESGAIDKTVTDTGNPASAPQSTSNDNQAQHASFRQQLASRLAEGGGYVALTAVATYFIISNF